MLLPPTHSQAQLFPASAQFYPSPQHLSYLLEPHHDLHVERECVSIADHALRYRLGIWLMALAVQYQDVNYVLSFAVRLRKYCTPLQCFIWQALSHSNTVCCQCPMAEVIKEKRRH